MKKIILFITYLSLTIYLYSQIITADSSDITPYRFAARLVADGHGNQQFFIIKVNSANKITSGDQISATSFINQALGKEKSLANPYKKNFFKENGIKDPEIALSLWKLRYAENPWKTDDSANMYGWTKRSAYPLIPYNSQLKILERYGMHNINDFIYGDNLFRLLKDMENPEWVQAYQDAANPQEDAELDKRRNYHRPDTTN